MPLASHVRCLLIALALATGAALAADDASQARLEALRQAVSQTTSPESPPTTTDPAVQICWTPHGDFSRMGVATEAPYGPRMLVARYSHPAVAANVPVAALWTCNGQPLSSSNCFMKPGVDFVSNALERREAPFSPGIYRVRFVREGTELAAGQITLLPPEPLGAREVKAVYMAGLKLLQEGLQAVDRGNAQVAGQAASKALPLLGTVVQAQATNRDAAGAFELSHALVAIGQMEAAGTRQRGGVTLDWARRALGHARSAQSLAADQGLQQAAGIMARTLEQALPKLREAATGN